MTINFTLIVQLVHFYLVYKVLDAFFFSYVLDCIVKDDQNHERKSVAIKRVQEQLAMNNVMRETSWRACNEFYKKHIAYDIDGSDHKEVKRINQYVPLNQEPDAIMVKDIARALCQRIMRDYL